MNPTTKYGFIYVIRAIETSFFKIGFSAKPEERLANLQTASPYQLKLLSSWPGTDKQERYIHKCLSEFRVSGEWFKMPSIDLDSIRAIGLAQDEPKLKSKPKRKDSGNLKSDFSVDPIRISKLNWRIRIRCRKARCAHKDHQKIFNVSLVSDSVFRRIKRDPKSYLIWKKSLIAECRKSLMEVQF